MAYAFAMGEENADTKKRQKGFPWFGAGFLVLACGTIGILFTDIPAKVNRNLRALMQSRQPAEVVDRKTIEMQIEQRLRAEMEIKLERELSASSYSFVIVSARVGHASMQRPQKTQRK